MDPATRLNRHAQLWSTGETSVRRIGLGGAIFALIILLTVIEPYHIESADTQNEIEVQEGKLEEVKAKLGAISEMQKQLEGLLTQLEKRPWTVEIEKLKEEFRNGKVTRPSERSAKALEAIATKLESDIVAPLRKASAQAPALLSGDNEFAKVPDSLSRAIVKWLNRYKKEFWWGTLRQKDNTAAAIGKDLTKILNDASTEASKIKEKLKVVAADRTKKRNDIVGAIESLLTNLQGVMDRALPIWARGILTVKQLLILFPWLLAGIAMYLVGTALRASRHFDAMADGEGWSAQERRDPLLSTAWTLTPRGALGSIAAFATYGSVLAVLGACLYRSLNPPMSASAGSVQASVDIIAAQSSTSALVACGFLLVAIATVGVALFANKSALKQI